MSDAKSKARERVDNLLKHTVAHGCSENEERTSAWAAAKLIAKHGLLDAVAPAPQPYVHAPQPRHDDGMARAEAQARMYKEMMLEFASQRDELRAARPESVVAAENVEEFLTYRCRFEPAARTLRSDLWEVYQKDVCKPGVGHRRFAAHLRKRGVVDGGSMRSPTDWKRVGDSWLGVRLALDDEE